MSKTVSELRSEALAISDRKVAEANEQFARDRAEEDRLFDAEFDKVRDEYERIRKRPRPTYQLATAKRDAAIADAEREVDDTMRRLYAEANIQDNRFN